jgi:hypothetical protein
MWNVDQGLQWTEQETKTQILSCSVITLIKIVFSSFFNVFKYVQFFPIKVLAQ